MKQLQQYQLAYISFGTFSKKYECKQQPSSISTTYEKSFWLTKIFSFIAGAVDTGD
jgi:hypothetical protein